MYFIANWKMFGDLRTLNSLDSVIKFSKNNKKKSKLIYCPPNTLIRPMSKRLQKTKIEVGAQNCQRALRRCCHVERHRRARHRRCTRI